MGAGVPMGTVRRLRQALQRLLEGIRRDDDLPPIRDWPMLEPSRLRERAMAKSSS